MGCSVTGRKDAAGPSTFVLPPKSEDVKAPTNAIVNLIRKDNLLLIFFDGCFFFFGIECNFEIFAGLFLGTIGGVYYFLVPVYMFLKHVLLWPLSLIWKDAHQKLM